MSVPRPAMLVATVTLPRWPAWATIWASISWFLAFRIWCSMPAASSSRLSFSDFSIDRVPISTGTPCLFHATIWSATAWNFSSSVEKTRSGSQTRRHGRLVGIFNTPTL